MDCQKEAGEIPERDVIVCEDRGRLEAMDVVSQCRR
jgi:hypothetical protein